MISRIINDRPIKEAKKLIDAANSIVTICHQGPDGDAVGSSLAARHVLAAMGKDCHVVVPDAPNHNLMALPGAKEIIQASKYPELAQKLFDQADLVLCLDFNALSRVGCVEPMLRACKAPKILVDHHLHPEDFATVVVSHPEMPATAYLLFRFLCRLELFGFINREAAQCILAGMMTDTGNFSYNCADPELYTVVAELIKKGADKEQLYRQLFNTTTLDCMRLNAYAISEKMEVYPQFHAALITLSRPELNRFHYRKGDTEGLVNQPLAIPGIDYCAFLREETDLIKVSMRSVGDFPVNEVCADHFGGGGHKNAAGGEYYGTLNDCAQLFRTLMPQNKEKYLGK